MLMYKFNKSPKYTTICSPQCAGNIHSTIIQYNLISEMYGKPERSDCIVCSGDRKDDQWLAVNVNSAKGPQIIALCCSVPCFKQFRGKLDLSCNLCNKKINDNVLLCDACKMAQYCSKDCQTADWKKHKPICSTSIINKIYPINENRAKYTCANCFKISSKKMKRCAKCQKVHYCSKKCQLEHWVKNHGARCEK